MRAKQKLVSFTPYELLLHAEKERLAAGRLEYDIEICTVYAERRAANERIVWNSLTMLKPFYELKDVVVERKQDQTNFSWL